MSDPTVRKRRLGGELRRMREAKGLKLDDVADKTPLNAVKVSRIENATVGVKLADLDALLDVYGVDDVSKRAALHSLAKEGSKRGWWQTYRPAISPAYADLISLEADAQNFRSYETALIPGLLQTAAYARSSIRAVGMTLPADRVDALVEVRVQRQAVLTRPEPLELWAVIHEAALHPTFAEPLLMRDQLQRLLDVSELPHVSIQVLPLDAGPNPGMLGPFSVLGFPGTADLDVVIVESLTSTLYVEEPAEVSIYGSAFERLRAAALAFDKSADLIARLKKDITT